MNTPSFVEPKVDRLPLSQGRYVDVKNRLNAGETRRVFGRMVKSMIAGEKITLDPEQVGFTKMVEYIIGWSLTTTEGQPVPVSEAAINNLDPDLYTEIRDAIETHENTVAAAMAEEKKDPAGESASSPTLPSAGS